MGEVGELELDVADADVENADAAEEAMRIEEAKEDTSMWTNGSPLYRGPTGAESEDRVKNVSDGSNIGPSPAPATSEKVPTWKPKTQRLVVVMQSTKRGPPKDPATVYRKCQRELKEW